MGQDITSVKDVQWLDVRPGATPSQRRPVATPGMIAETGKVFRADPDTLRTLAETNGFYGPAAIAALAKVKATCGDPFMAGPWGTLSAYFYSPTGHLTTVAFRAYSPPDEPQKQSFRIESITRQFADAISYEQRAELQKELVKQYQQLIKAAVAYGAHPEQLPSVSFSDTNGFAVNLRDRVDIWMGARNRLLLHSACGGATKININ